MTSSDLYLKLLRGGIFVSLLVPLIIFAQFISPFHFGKTVVFRSLVEIMAVIYILLIISNKKYLPQWKPIVLAFTIFTALYTLTSFTAADFNYAFWGTLERMGGLFSFLHFWVFFIILVSVFRESKAWEKLLKLSVFVGLLSVLFAYGQRFIQGKFFVGWQHGERIIGTIGNPALFAGYLLFVLFLSIYFLLCKETKAIERGFYGAVFILGAPVLHMTAVRGSMIAFWGGLFLLGLFYLFGLKNKKVKIYIFIALLLFLILAGFIWLSRNQDWVRNSDWLRRLTGISITESTAQTRFWSWYSGLLGWKERPILGWGPENFVLAHAKYFDPRHFTGFGAETIWDRAHNMVLETLTTMGIVGCLSYLSIFVVIYYLLIKRFTPLETKKSDEARESKISLTGFKKKRIGLAEISVFGSLIAAYFVHNLFIFDTAANYYMFFLVLGYLNFIICRNTPSSINPTDLTTGQAQINPPLADTQIRAEKGPNIILMAILIILVSILIYKTNIEPSRANYATTRAILAGRKGDAQTALAKYKEALSYKSPQGKYEIRQKLATFIFQIEDGLRKSNKHVSRDLLNYVIEEVKKSIEDHPLDYVSYLYIGRSYVIIIGQEPDAGEMAETYIREAAAINPRNPRIWYELGQASLSQKKFDSAIAAFKKALELNPNVRESNWFLGMAHAQAGNEEEAIKYIEQAIAMGYTYKNSLNDIVRLINLYNNVQDYYKIIELYKLAILEQPKNTQFYASLAAVYKKIGDIENAILWAKKAGEINPNFASESEAFINSLR